MPYFGSNTNLHFQAGMTSPDDGAYEDLQRQLGVYEPGSSESMEDRFTQGSDDVE